MKLCGFSLDFSLHFCCSHSTLSEIYSSSFERKRKKKVFMFQWIKLEISSSIHSFSLGLIMQHLIVRKLTRRELEDKYLRLIDENFDLKRENNVQREKIKVLTTKLLRVSRENNKFKSREFLFMDAADESELVADNTQHQSTAVEFMRYRPSSTSVLLHRTFSRGSTRRWATCFIDKFLYTENPFHLKFLLETFSSTLYVLWTLCAF